MGDAIITAILILILLISSFIGVTHSVNELHQSRKDSRVLRGLGIEDGRRDIVIYEWWRHLFRFIGCLSFFLIAITAVVGYDVTSDISVPRLIVRLLLIICVLSMASNSWVDRKSRKKTLNSSFQ